MTARLTDTRGWVRTGTELFLEEVGRLTEDDLEAPSALPGWTRKHVIAHVASNAVALGHLVDWAATGKPTPMYGSMEQRNADIEAGAKLGGNELVERAVATALSLDTAMDRLTNEQWAHDVVTIQGRTVQATEIGWLRAREVCVHAVDLGTGLSFNDLPEAFLVALRDEIATRRSLEVLPGASTADVAAWLAGRPHQIAGAPGLAPWL